MADSKISALTSATTPLAGTEVVPVVQSSATKKVSIANLTAGRAVAGTSFSATTWLAGQAPRQNPNTSGTAVDYALRVADNVGSITLDMGQTNVPAVNTAWMQVRNQGNFGLYYNLVLQPNGGQVHIGTLTTPVAGTKFAVSGGDISALTGNFVIGTSGKGIDFSANAHATGMTSELLNDYEEGTWTPSLVPGTSGSITLTTAAAKYTKVGRAVTVTGICEVASVASPVGALLLQGLPFTNSADTSSRSAAAIYATGLAATATTAIMGRIIPSESQIRIEKFAAGSASALADDVQSNAIIQFNLTYFV